MIVHREVIPGTVINVVHDVIQGQQGFRFVRLQRHRDSGDGITDGKEIHLSLGTMVSAAHENPIITPGSGVAHPEGERCTSG